MKPLLVVIVVVSIIVIGLTLRANVTEYTNMEVEPVVEMTTEEKYQAAKAEIEAEIADLEAQQEAIEAEIERKKSLIGALPE